MTTWQTIALGAIAGFTIFLGLPLGRVRARAMGLRTLLSGFSAGILVFLLFDILSHATEPVEEAMTASAWGHLAGLGAVYVVGFGVGLMSIVYFNRLTRPTPRPGVGPGTMAVAEVTGPTDQEVLNLGMAIAGAIGLHNFAEGLAIGQAAQAGEISLAVLLVVGFALHNATEGFGIVGPLAGSGVQASWRWILLAGLIGGGPTFLGTIVGTAFSSEYVFVAFLALAAGAILYVIGELFVAGRRLSWVMTLWGVFGGFILALATDLLIEAVGG
ncbi:MAG: zinc permease [Acidimicrobiia bacterium]